MSEPTEEKLIARLRELLAESDLETTTEKMLRKKLEEEYGVELTDRKALIRKEVRGRPLQGLSRIPQALRPPLPVAAVPPTTHTHPQSPLQVEKYLEEQQGEDDDGEEEVEEEKP